MSARVPSHTFLYSATSPPPVSVEIGLDLDMKTSHLIVVSIGSLAFGQTNFGGSGSSSGSASSSQEFPLGSLDTDTRYLLKSSLKQILIPPFLRFFTGNEALNGGLVGAGLGALGATILGPAGA